jgi:hypothetical protein
MGDDSARHPATAVWNDEQLESGASSPRVEAFTLSLLALRFFALALVIIGLLQAIANILETVREFNPSHAGYYFKSQLLRPVILIVGGLLTWAFGHPLSGWISMGLGP